METGGCAARFVCLLAARGRNIIAEDFMKVSRHIAVAAAVFAAWGSRGQDATNFTPRVPRKFEQPAEIAVPFNRTVPKQREEMFPYLPNIGGGSADAFSGDVTARAPSTAPVRRSNQQNQKKDNLSDDLSPGADEELAEKKSGKLSDRVLKKEFSGGKSKADKSGEKNSEDGSVLAKTGGEDSRNSRFDLAKERPGNSRDDGAAKKTDSDVLPGDDMRANDKSMMPVVENLSKQLAVHNDSDPRDGDARAHEQQMDVPPPEVSSRIESLAQKPGKDYSARPAFGFTPTPLGGGDFHSVFSSLDRSSGGGSFSPLAQMPSPPSGAFGATPGGWINSGLPAPAMPALPDSAQAGASRSIFSHDSVSPGLSGPQKSGDDSQFKKTTTLPW